MSQRLRRNLGLLVLLLLFAADLSARIKLITLPVREQVEIDLSHADVTLVEEERVVPLVEGHNQVDFSWSTASIDPDSVLFRLVDAEGESPSAAAVRVLSVSYPPAESALIWNLWAERAGSVRVRIGYLVGGLKKGYHYRATADHAAQRLVLQQYLRINNRANESFEKARLKSGEGEPMVRSLGIAESQELLLQTYADVPITKRYTADWRTHGYLDEPQKKLRIPLRYVLTNDGEHGLGQGALPFGKVRIFQQDGKGGTAFVGEDWGEFTPLESELSLDLGVARDIVVKRTIDRNEAERVNGNLYHYDLVVKYEIENFKREPVTLELVEDLMALRSEVGRNSSREVEWVLGEETTLQGGPDPERSTSKRLLFQLQLPPRVGEEKVVSLTHKLHFKIRNEW